MAKIVLRCLLCVGLISFCAVLFAPETAHAQARTWHYNSNNYTQPGSLPWYYGAPNRRLPFWRRPAAIVTPAVIQPASPCGGCAVAAPVASCASPCSTGGYTQTVGYVPRTVYRTVYRPVPVTRYQAVSSCGPCGQAVTAYRPVTTYAHQAQRVAMTSYLAVPTVTYRPTCVTSACATSLCATGACGVSSPCASGACGVTTAGYYTPSSSCSSCAPASTVIPATSNIPLQPTPATDLGSGTDQGGSNGETGKTFKTEKPPVEDDMSLKGPANRGVNVEMGKEVEPSALRRERFTTPRFLSPKDLTTQRNRSLRVRTAVHTQPVGRKPAASLSQVEQDAQGWESVSGK